MISLKLRIALEGGSKGDERDVYREGVGRKLYVRTQYTQIVSYGTTTTNKQNIKAGWFWGFFGIGSWGYVCVSV